MKYLQTLMTGLRWTTRRARPWVLTLLLTVPLVGTAQTAAFTNPLKFDTIEQLLLAILDAAVLILFPIVVLALVYSGFLFVKAQGQPAELETAKRAMLWGLIGGGIVLGAKALALALAATVDQLRS